jgi:hypothetical protein
MTTVDDSDVALSQEGMEDFPWDLIIEAMEDQELTPFLGAGISNPPLPAGRELAQKLAAAYDYPFKSMELLEVAQYVATLKVSSAPKRFIRKLFEQAPEPNFLSPTQPHAILAGLPVPVYLTTNYDTYMEQALTAHNRSPRSEICRWNNALKLRYDDTLSDSEPEVGKPVVFHLHGSIEDQDSFVLTEDDYLDFMVNARRYEGSSDLSARYIPPKVDELMALNSLLFLGYGLRDWNLRVLLRTLVQSLEKSQQKLSVSVQLEPDDRVVEAVGKRAAIKYLNKYFDGLRIVVYWGTLDEFLSELKRRWVDSRPELPAGRGDV